MKSYWLAMDSTFSKAIDETEVALLKEGLDKDCISLYDDETDSLGHYDDAQLTALEDILKQEMNHIYNRFFTDFENLIAGCKAKMELTPQLQVEFEQDFREDAQHIDILRDTISIQNLSVTLSDDFIDQMISKLSSEEKRILPSKTIQSVRNQFEEISDRIQAELKETEIQRKAEHSGALIDYALMMYKISFDKGYKKYMPAQEMLELHSNSKSSVMDNLQEKCEEMDEARRSDIVDTVRGNIDYRFETRSKDHEDQNAEQEAMLNCKFQELEANFCSQMSEFVSKPKNYDMEAFRDLYTQQKQHILKICKDSPFDSERHREKLILMVNEMLESGIQTYEAEFDAKIQGWRNDFEIRFPELKEALLKKYRSETKGSNYSNELELKKHHDQVCTRLVNTFSSDHGAKEDQALIDSFLSNHLVPSFRTEREECLHMFMKEKLMFDEMMEHAIEKYKTDMKALLSASAKFVEPNTLLKEHFKLGDTFEKDLNEKKVSKIRIGEAWATLDNLLDGFRRQNDAKTPGDTPAIGIDLGTTYSCVGVYQNGKVRSVTKLNSVLVKAHFSVYTIQSFLILIIFQVEIIRDEKNSGANTIPSYVAFSSDGEVVGKAAKENARNDPKKTIFNVKRFIGRNFNDRKVKKLIKDCPYTVKKNTEGHPAVELQYNGMVVSHNPEVVSAKILGALKTAAEGFLQKEVRKAVITVPAYFNDSQRQATKQAAEIAGLDVLQLQNEPTAAALAYTFQNPSDEPQTLLVFDLGGGTFDVSILKVNGGKIAVQAVGGDDYLGGEDFDLTLVNYCIQQFESTNGIKIDQNSDKEKTQAKYRSSWLRLKYECEEKKKTLSSTDEVTLALDVWYSGLDLKVTLTRKQFEKMNEKMFKKTMKIVDDTLADAKLTADQINTVVLVGGSSRIPKIRELLAEKFQEHRLMSKINADEAVAYGSAIQAAMLNGVVEQQLKGISLQNVIPMSIGVELKTGKLSPLIPKNSPTPCKKERIYHTTGSKVKIQVYEGENVDCAAENHELGMFELEPTKPGVTEEIKVTMEIDNEGILSVKAASLSDVTRGKEIKIVENRGQLSSEQLKRIKTQERYSNLCCQIIIYSALGLPTELFNKYFTGEEMLPSIAISATFCSSNNIYGIHLYIDSL